MEDSSNIDMCVSLSVKKITLIKTEKQKNNVKGRQ